MQSSRKTMYLGPLLLTVLGRKESCHYSIVQDARFPLPFFLLHNSATILFNITFKSNDSPNLPLSSRHTPSLSYRMVSLVQTQGFFRTQPNVSMRIMTNCRLVISSVSLLFLMAIHDIIYLHFFFCLFSLISIVVCQDKKLFC